MKPTTSRAEEEPYRASHASPTEYNCLNVRRHVSLHEPKEQAKEWCDIISIQEEAFRNSEDRRRRRPKPERTERRRRGRSRKQKCLWRNDLTLMLPSATAQTLKPWTEKPQRLMNGGNGKGRSLASNVGTQIRERTKAIIHDIKPLLITLSYLRTTSSQKLSMWQN